MRISDFRADIAMKIQLKNSHVSGKFKAPPENLNQIFPFFTAGAETGAGRATEPDAMANILYLALPPAVVACFMLVKGVSGEVA
jgi:hypothetical protein